MEPAELPSTMPEALARGLVGVLFDVDDTVARAGRLERGAFNAMWRLADAGLALAVVTGRPLGWTDVLARQWPVRVAIGENGAGWTWRDGEAVRDGYFETEGERARSRTVVERVIERVAREVPEARLAGDQRARRCDAAFDVGETVQLAPAHVAAIVRAVEAEGARAVVSTVHVHVVAGGWNKGLGALRALGDAVGSDAARPEKWLFVGDSGNDGAAFERFPHGAGVANVRPWLDRLPRAPRWIAAADRGRGFAEIADAVLARRGGAR